MSNYCPECHTHEPDARAKYCSACGAELTDSVPVNVCPNCQENLQILAHYCTNCGAKLPEGDSDAG